MPGAKLDKVDRLAVLLLRRLDEIGQERLQVGKALSEIGGFSDLVDGVIENGDTGFEQCGRIGLLDNLEDLLAVSFDAEGAVRASRISRS